MEIKLCGKATLTKEKCGQGLEFIRKCFIEHWGIFRSDVTYEIVWNRKNIILSNNGKVIGWLGIEDDNEITNACIEKGYHGLDLLSKMVQLIRPKLGEASYYAFVPYESLGPARTFIRVGFDVQIPPDVKVMVYPERSVRLIKLVMGASEHFYVNVSECHLEKQLNIIKGISDGYLC
jgi:hypothetical protein